MNKLVADAVKELRLYIDSDPVDDIWNEPGVRELDLAIDVIADLYLDHPELQNEIREDISRISNSWALVLYIRRVSLLIEEPTDERPILRGLAVAAMIDVGCDFRDLIVSLVVLRASGDVAGIDSKEFFVKAEKWSTSRIHGVLQNARDHSDSDTAATLSSFEPPEAEEAYLRFLKTRDNNTNRSSN